MRVLVAEDEQVVAGILGKMLRARGHEVAVADSGDKAWALFDAEPAHMVISDWVMPGLTGIELCEHIRTRPRTDYCYFIMVTAVAGRENLKLAMDAGIDDFLMKPVNEQQLVMRVRVAERIISYMSQINRLESLLPICSYCRRIRDDANGWLEMENYVREKSGARFSHGICPDCMERVARQRPTATA